MANRSHDWVTQALRNLEQAVDSASAGRHEWACFAAQQAAEMAVKAVHLSLGQEAWGHVVRRLLEELPQAVGVTPEMLDAARTLDLHYLPTRYPNGHDAGAPENPRLLIKAVITTAIATLLTAGLAAAVANDLIAIRDLLF